MDAANMQVDLSAPDDIALADRMKHGQDRIRHELRKLIIGQDEVLQQVLLSLFVGGNSLIIGVPGLAKTLLIHTLARVVDLKFARIQFTPDLMPSDITGTDILEEDRSTGRREMRFLRGPLFANIVLADEVNRTPPKTQAALLQAMAEYRITAGGRTYPLDLPFLVFATQNPIEQEGSYPLPEAQLDRFMFLVDVGYPTAEEELRIVQMTTAGAPAALTKVLSPQTIQDLQEVVRRVPVPEHVVKHAVDLVRATRPKEPGAFDFVQRYVSWGAGPRASQNLIIGAKARAILQGRYAASVEDVRALALSVLRHRIVANFTAESEGITPSKLVAMVLDRVKA